MITRLLQLIIVCSLLAIVLTVFNSGASSAHNAVFVDSLPHNTGQAIAFEQPDIDRVFYANLANSATVDFYTFQGKQGFSFRSKILIPRLPGLDKFHPALALFGPGLPKPDEVQTYEIPFNLPQNEGLVTSEQDQSNNVKSNDTLYSHYDEPFTQSSYWVGQTLIRQLPQDGTYYLAVYSPQNQGGKYALETGNRDATSIKETLGFPVLWFRLKFWFDDALSAAMLVVTVLLVIVAVVIGRSALRQNSPHLATFGNDLTVIPVVKESPAATTEPLLAAVTTTVEENPVIGELASENTVARWRKGKLKARLEQDFLNSTDTIRTDPDK